MTRLAHDAKLYQPPTRPHLAVAQQKNLHPHILSSSDPVAALELDIARSWTDLPGGADHGLDLLGGRDEISQKRCRLSGSQCHRGISPGKLHQ